MSSVQYPFIDIAAHQRVRGHFAAGKALVLFSRDMADVLWANGRGAQLFGREAIYDIIDQGPAKGDLTYRQMQATARQLSAPGDTSSFIMRMTAGFQRVAVNALCEVIRLANGQDAILLAVPAGDKPPLPADCARQMLEGFDDPGMHMAVLDSKGALIATSPDFATLNLTPQTARMLVTLAENDRDRLVKRPVPTAIGYLPGAIAKLSDEPALHLLLLVQADAGAIAEPVPTEPAPAQESPAEPEPVSLQPAPVVAVDTFEAAIEAVSEIAELDEDTLEEAEFAAPLTEDASHTEAETAAPNRDETVDAPVQDSVAETVPEAIEETIEEEVPAPVPAFGFRRETRATRFVWKIDADGHFSEVSPELAASVGPHAGQVIGLAFTDVAALFNLDPDNRIAELLSRRDTWSGKTIWWPVEGTALRVPIDLAALPTYTRNRDFDGFRGFGIVRIADVQDDPQAVGLTLSPRSEVEADEQAADPDEVDAEGAGFSLPDVVENAEIIDEDEAAADAGEDEEPVEDLAEDDADLDEVDDALSEAQIAPKVTTPLPLPLVEKPVLRIVENPGQRHSDKVIRFDERRTQAREGLSPGEQAAFREIARRLDEFRQGDDTEADKAVPAEASVDAFSAALPEVEEPPIQDVLYDAPMIDLPDTAGEDEGEPETVEEPSPAAEETEAEVADAVEIPVSEPVEPISAPVEDDRISLVEAYAQAVPLRARPDLSAEIIDQMPVALLVHAGETLIHGNPEFLRLTGYGSIAELAEVGGLDALLQRQDLEDKTAEAGGMVVVRADDAIVPVSARLQSVRWEHSTALILALMPMGEIVEKPPVVIEPDPEAVAEGARQVEELSRLAIEVEELRSILDTATDGVVIIDMNGEIRSMNRAASALFNYDNAETGGKPFVMLFAHESQKSVLDYLAGLAGHGVASLLNDGREVIGREASGGFLPLFMTIGHLTSSNGYCAVIRDITQWKRTEEELRNAKRAAETANAHKSDFLAHVSHEIRTPLNAIIGFADMMATERLGPIGHARYVEYANDIGRSGRHVLDIVNDLLDISKIEAGEMELDFASVGLNETVSEAVSLVQPQANGQRVIIRTALSQSVPPVVADLRSIKQIVLNILSNAIRFTPSGGQIVVSTAYEANGNVVLRIRDTGIGMTRPELELAMKPFRQVAGGTRKRGDGTGLGLPLTKAMVDANRAAFAIHSAPNEGTLVEVTFPSPRVLAN
ncbi:ATP-binding protein [Rhizobium sp. FY34]|uniref:ATP-binding protein n=1 Tax=Rhizobium sp. FY34 TaxID=2562309 RepID=UPI0010C07A07|nr:ATP-binding protein [Rhizobium sp. FY34]